MCIELTKIFENYTFDRTKRSTPREKLYLYVQHNILLMRREETVILDVETHTFIVYILTDCNFKKQCSKRKKIQHC